LGGRSLPDTVPNIAEILKKAHQNRTAILNTRARGIRLAGLDEWLGYLKDLEVEFTRPRLAPIKFLLARVCSDYEAAIEATLSGFPCVVFDSMRDVMEVDLLLQDFAADPEQVKLWLEADSKKLMYDFAPKHLRKRKAKRLGVDDPRKLPDSRDYAGHCHALHVQPRTFPHERRGLIEVGHPALDDFCFWEMLGHALGLCATFRDLITALAPGSTVAADPIQRLPKLHEAYSRVRDWNSLMGEVTKASQQ